MSSSPFTPGDPEKEIELTGLIDEGSSGAVFSGRFMANSSQESVAVKVVCMDDADVKRDTLREIEMLKKLSGNDHCLRLFAAYEKENHAWMVLEFCEAGSLIDLYMISSSTAKREEARSVMTSVLLALSHLESMHIVHRDVKGKNLLLTRDGRIKLGDFGISIQLETANPKQLPPAGSCHWLSPEAAQGIVHPKNDVWALGITLIEIMEGQPPRAHVAPIQVLETIAKSPPPTFTDARLTKNEDKEMSDFLTNCLTKDLLQRASAKELLRHPFIEREAVRFVTDRANHVSPPIRKLIDENFARILEFREYEATAGSIPGQPPPSPTISKIKEGEKRLSSSDLLPRAGVLAATAAAAATGPSSSGSGSRSSPKRKEGKGGRDDSSGNSSNKARPMSVKVRQLQVRTLQTAAAPSWKIAELMRDLEIA